MVKLRAIHLVSIGIILIIYALSVVLVLAASYSLPVAMLFSFLNVIGATFPPVDSLIDAHNPFVLATDALGAIASIALTITFTTIFYQLMKNIDLRYLFSKQKVRGISGHVVITPINGIALELAKKLRASNVPFVFIDENMSNVRRALRRGMLAVHGNSVEIEALSQARIDQAIALYALFDDDIKNTLVTIEARRNGKRIRVISRIKRLEDIPKMEKAGARRTILPEAAVGIEMSDFLVANT